MRDRLFGARMRLRKAVGEEFRLRLFALTCVLTAGMFVLDVNMPKRASASALYVAVVLLVGLHMPRWAVGSSALLCTALTGLGYWLSPADANPAWAAANGLIALVAIWVAAGVIWRIQGRGGAPRASRRAPEGPGDEAGGAVLGLGQVNATLDQTLDTIFMFDPQSLRFFYINRGASQQVGYSREELLGMTPLDIKPEFDERAFREVVQPLLDGSESSVTFETVHRHKKGHNIPVEVLLQLVRPEGGDPRFLAVVRDISERKRAEAELRERDARLRLLTNAVPVMIAYVDAEQRYRFNNSVHASNLASTPEALYGRKMSEVFSPESYASFRSCVERALAGEEVFNEGRTTYPDGTTRDFRAVYIPDFGENGGVRGFSLMAEDITERKRADEELRAGQRLLQTMFDTIPIGLFLKDTERRYVMMNRQTAGENRVDPRTVIGRRTEDVPEWRAIDKDLIREEDLRVLSEGLVIDEPERPITYLDGSKGWHRTIKAPLRDETGKIIGLLGVREDVTERKQAEEELRASQRLLQTMFDTIPIGLFIKDTEHRYVMMNRENLRRIELEADALIGKRGEDILQWSEEERRVVNEEDNLVLTQGTLMEIPERRIENANGTAWRRIIKAPLRDETGRIIGLIGVREDITERKQAEAALQESELRLRAVVENAPIILFALDPQGTLTMLEGKGLDSLEVQADKAVGKSYFDLLGHDSVFASDARRALAGEHVSGVREFGGILFEHRYTPIFDAEGKPAGAIGLSLDITDAEQARGQYRASQRLLEAIFDIIPVAVFVRDAAGHFLRVNKAFAQELQLQPEEILAKPVVETFSGTPEQREQAMAEDREVLERGAMIRIPEKPISAPEGVRWWEVFKAPLRDDAGNIIGIVGSRVDLTDRKAVEERLRAKQKLEAIGQLAGGVAHEFNNLLQMILGFTELALDATDPDDGRHANLTMVRNASQKGAQLVRQLLDYSRRQLLEPEVLDINALIRSNLSVLMATLGPRHPLRFIPGKEVKPIRADGTTIEQAMVNLCLNARDAMPAGGQVVIETATVNGGHAHHVAGHSNDGGEYVRISVTDTGQGMEPEVIDRIFDPFFTTKGPQAGTGLGLSQVHGFINQQGGFIDVVSRPGKGTTLHLCLPPAGAEAPVAKRAGPAVPGRPATAGRVGRGTVLVAEDERGVQRIAVQILENAGFRVLQARDGAEAVRLFEDEPDGIDLVLLDVVMPRMGGREACERIRALRADVPVVFHTAYGLGQDQVSALTGRGHKLLVKPYPAEALRRVVDELLVAKSA